MSGSSSICLVALTLLLSQQFTADAFSIKSVEQTTCSPAAPAPVAAETTTRTPANNEHKERPLLQNFGKQIQKRIVNSKSGAHRFGMKGAYTSDETFPCLDMQCNTGGEKENNNDDDSIFSSRREIRDAFNESSGTSNNSNNDNSDDYIPGIHGRSSGSGCSIIRLSGEDAASIRGLTEYANEFFEKVDYDDTNKKSMKDVGVFRIDQFVYAGFDENVNDEGKMQFLDTRILPYRTCNNYQEPTLIPLEVGELVGETSLSDAHKGINTLMDIGYQITSAVLEMQSDSANKLIDDGTRLEEDNQSMIGSDLPGLEIWSPCLKNGKDGQDGEWVRPIKPDCYDEEDNSAYIIAMAGEFLQLTSNGKVPTCIHRVLPPMHGRISAPLFLRPRRGDDALLDVDLDLGQTYNKDGLYNEPGLLDECDSMHLWSVHGILVN
ncbi:hypothetical protein QTG54_009118 [Skeletonema marinoi]|uniref:Isopenicillin N synthase-like Fe(2+) 2OG dioxygenase domain-containing protein n=1 Tax=Skeletonema marinoi TaxID=267567 RepID=A0AAD8Y5S4_9STRA|nr:hypothetical protein QTG54_009118 [Skeletonema marinoi]